MQSPPSTTPPKTVPEERLSREEADRSFGDHHIEDDTPKVVLVLDTPDDDSSLAQQSEHIKNLEQELMKTRLALEETRLLLEEAQVNLKEAEDKRNETQSELKETAVELAAITDEWKTSAGELRELKAKDQTGFLLTDGDLTQRVRHLRFAIKTFSLQYFQDQIMKETNTHWKEDTAYFSCLQSTTPKSSSYANYLTSPTLRPKVIQAFLWRVLRYDVFYMCHWAGKLTSRCFRDLWFSLDPANCREQFSPSREQEFQMWSARTAQLCVNALRTGYRQRQEAQEFLRQCRKFFIKTVSDTIGLGSSPNSRDITKQLHEIFCIAIELDEDINRQAARVMWVYEYEGLPDEYVEFEVMESKGDSPSAKEEEKSQKEPMVVAPALVKRGKSTGQDFHIENTLLKMVVLCS